MISSQVFYLHKYKVFSQDTKHILRRFSLSFKRSIINVGYSCHVPNKMVTKACINEFKSLIVLMDIMFWGLFIINCPFNILI